MRFIAFILVRGLVVWISSAVPAVVNAAAERPPSGEVLSIQGEVEISTNKVRWSKAQTGQKLYPYDQVRALAASRALLRIQSLGRVRLNELTTITILPPNIEKGESKLNIQEGGLYLFNRDQRQKFLLETPTAVGATRGTEVLVRVKAGGASMFVVIEGGLDVANGSGTVALGEGEQSEVGSTEAPAKSRSLMVDRLVQWCLYYPAILPASEFADRGAIRPECGEALAAYEAGDIVGALAVWPAGAVDLSEAERLFLSALLLGAGQVDGAEGQLQQVLSFPDQVAALRELIGVVRSPASAVLKGGPGGVRPSGNRFASQLLAASYSWQGRFQLERALESARAAVDVVPSFGFGRIRVAELEFAFGRTRQAHESLDEGLSMAPRAAAGWSLRGYILAAENRWEDALEAFERAVSLESGLGNAWLGKGLCKIKLGRGEEGLHDLESAAALEPNRAILRSYLAKGFASRHENASALRELELAKVLDPADPTPWLYSGLLNYQGNRINEAVADLDRSLDLNDNRRVYRSRFLLDQDRGVRSASLANVYLQGGLLAASLQEASRAVAYDYGNYSAHRFLADSFNALRDPTRFNLRYETAWFNELLLADMLAPATAPALPLNTSEQEYFGLVEKRSFGLNTFTEARSDKQVREIASQYGAFGGASYSLDLEYQYNAGIRANNDLSRMEWYGKIKQQLSARDALYLLTKVQDYESGDNFQYYNPDVSFRPSFRFEESQAPYFAAGYHREWNPGVHTLFLAGYFTVEQTVRESRVPFNVFRYNAAGGFVTNILQNFDVAYENDYRLFSSELSQVFQTDLTTAVVGARYQHGEFETDDRLTFPSTGINPALLYRSPPASTHVEPDVDRVSGYGYLTRELLPNFFATAGLSYEALAYPLNHRLPPVSEEERTRSQVNLKGGVVWIPAKYLTLRGAYSRFLGGVSFDESYRLEPSQIAGFTQSYRSTISESVAGSVSGASSEIYGVAADMKIAARTYAGVEARRLSSDVEQSQGIFEFRRIPIEPANTPLELEYQEDVLQLWIEQLLWDRWSAGLRYQLTDSNLRRYLPVAAGTLASADATVGSVLHEWTPFVGVNHASGLFALLESPVLLQSNTGYRPDLPGDTLHQLNFTVGYRLPRQRGSVALSLLNLTSEDYRLNPLTPYAELPRGFVVAGRLKLQF